MTPYFPLTPTLSPFTWSWVAGEGETAGIRIDGSGQGIYNVIRPRLPIAANDGITFTVQCRVRSRLVLNGDRQGFTTQVRGFRQDGTSIVERFSNNVRADQDSWYTRQDPDYVLHTVRVLIPSGTGITHLTVEPMVHAASGFCEITSCRVRVSYESLIEYRRDAESHGFNQGDYYQQRGMVTRVANINANQEMIMDFAAEAVNDWGAQQYIVFIKLRKKNSGNYDEIRFIVVTLEDTSQYTPLVGSRTVITDDEYDQVELYVAAASGRVVFDNQGPPTGVFTLRNISFRLLTRDVLRDGA